MILWHVIVAIVSLSGIVQMHSPHEYASQRECMAHVQADAIEITAEIVDGKPDVDVYARCEKSEAI